MTDTEADETTSPLFNPSLSTKSLDSKGPRAYVAVWGGSFISRYQSLVPGISLGERSDPSGSAVLGRDVARDVGLEVSRDWGRGGVLTTEVGLVVVGLATVEPAKVELATLEVPLLLLELCFAIRSEIEDIIDGDEDLTEPPLEEWIEILRSRSSTGDFVLAVSS